MSLQVRQIEDGIVFSIKVSAGARKNEARGVHNGALKVAVTAIAEKGKANKVVIGWLAKELRVAKNQLRIISGDFSNAKTIQVTGANPRLLAQRLADLSQTP